MGGWVYVALSRKITKYEILHWVSADGSKITIQSLITAWEGKTIVNSTTTCQLEEESSSRGSLMNRKWYVCVLPSQQARAYSGTGVRVE